MDQLVLQAAAAGASAEKGDIEEKWAAVNQLRLKVESFFKQILDQFQFQLHISNFSFGRSWKARIGAITTDQNEMDGSSTFRSIGSSIIGVNWFAYIAQISSRVFPLIALETDG